MIRFALAVLVGIALGVSAMVLRQPRVCDRVIAVPYELGERPVCVVVKRIEPR